MQMDFLYKENTVILTLNTWTAFLGAAELPDTHYDALDGSEERGSTLFSLGGLSRRNLYIR